MENLTKIGEIEVKDINKRLLAIKALENLGFVVMCIADGMYNEYGEIISVFENKG